MTRTRIIARSVLGIIGFVFLLLCGAYVAIAGWAFSEGGPHAFKGDVGIGLMFGLIAFALMVAAVVCSGVRSAVYAHCATRHSAESKLATSELGRINSVAATRMSGRVTSRRASVVAGDPC